MSNLPILPDSFKLDDYNILLITVEAFRVDETSFKKPKLNLTPRLLEYAKNDAYWFTRAYVGSSYTLQSMATLFAFIDLR